MIAWDDALPVILELARRAGRVYDHAPFLAFVEKWTSHPEDPDEERAIVAEYHGFRKAFEGLVRPAPACEGYVVGTDYALAFREAIMLLGALASPERWDEINAEIEDGVENLRKRLDRVELERIPVVRPKIYDGPVVS